jgi:hypothetical protein
MISTGVYVWAKTLLRASSKNAALLYVGMTTLINGRVFMSGFLRGGSTQGRRHAHSPFNYVAEPHACGESPTTSIKDELGKKQ